MIVAVDAATCVAPDPADPRRYAALPGAREALRRLRAQGHVVVFVSAATAPWAAEDWRSNPLWASRAVPFDHGTWQRDKASAAAERAMEQAGLDAEFPGIPYDATGAYALCADALVSESAGFDVRDTTRAWRRFVARIA